MKPFEPFDGDRESHVRLHVRRMFITDKAELLPSWLRFVQGVVDTEDLPLNVSREMLQTTPVLGRIRKALIGRVLSELKNRAKDAEDYGKFWDNFGAVLKEGRLGGRRAPRRDRAAAAVPIVLAGRAGPRCPTTSRACRRGRTRSGTWPATIRMRCAPRRSSRASAPRASRCCCCPIRSTRSGRNGWIVSRESTLKSVTQASGELGQGRGPARHLAAAGSAEEGAGRRGDRCSRHRPADRQRGGAGGRRTGALTCRCSACCAAPGAPCCRPRRCWRSIRATR